MRMYLKPECEKRLLRELLEGKTFRVVEMNPPLQQHVCVDYESTYTGRVETLNCVCVRRYFPGESRANATFTLKLLSSQRGKVLDRLRVMG